jgi:hypothetical protein
MMLFVFGFISSIYQYFPAIIFQENTFFRSMQYLGTLTLVFYSLERSGIHEKKINVSVGFALIITGLLADYITSE